MANLELYVEKTTIFIKNQKYVGSPKLLHILVAHKKLYYRVNFQLKIISSLGENRIYVF